jgi:hypothetical protein
MNCLTEAERAVLLKRLAEAEEARHQLAIGGGVKVFVDQNGERIEYTNANMTALNKYINGLQLKLGCGETEGPAPIWLA